MKDLLIGIFAVGVHASEYLYCTTASCWSLTLDMPHDVSQLTEASSAIHTWLRPPRNLVCDSV